MGIGALGAAVTLLAAFVVVVENRERRGFVNAGLALVLALTVVDGALFPKAGDQNGAFVLAVGPIADTPPLFLIPVLCLVAALGARGPLRGGPSLLAWGAYFCWLAVETLAGYLRGYAVSTIVQEAKVFVFTAALAALAARTDLRQLVQGPGLRRVLRCSAAVAALLVVTSVLGISSSAGVGLFTLRNTGTMGADVASIFASIGLVGLAVTLSRRTHRRELLVPSLVLLLAPFFTGQRASLLGIVAGVAVVGVGALAPLRRPLRGWTPGDVRLVLRGIGAGALALVVLGLLLPAGLLANNDITSAFESQGKADSAQSRINQWIQAGELVAQKPAYGWGIGKEYLHVEVVKNAPDPLVSSPLTHDIFLDVALRTGLVGLVLLLVAMAVTLRTGYVGAARGVDAGAAAIGLGAAAVLTELIVRGAVESIFEKPRLAVCLGLAIGLAVAAERAARVSRRRGDEPSSPRAQAPSLAAS